LIIDEEIAQIPLNWIFSSGGAAGSPGRNRKPKLIGAFKQKRHKCQPFIVADIESLLINEIHVPYAAGFLLWNPEDDVASMDNKIETDSSENYEFVLPDFADRSPKM
jgi:hypothetical protein